MRFPEIVEKTKKIDEKDMEPEIKYMYRIQILDHHHHHGQGNSETIKTTKENLDPRETQFRAIWHKIFLLCFVVAASLDPLFFYIPIINDQKKCLVMDDRLKKTMLVLRSIMDLTYIFHIAFQIFSGYSAYTSESGGLLARKEKFIDQILGVIRRIRWWTIIIDILCVLPIPQAVILVYFSKMKGLQSLNTRKILNLFVVFQFWTRIFRIYLSCKGLTKNLSLSPRQISGASWVKGLFNFFLYIIASHVFGAFWYFFSIQRESACWQYACKGNSMCNQSNFFCDIRSDIIDDPIVDYLNRSCPLTQSSSFNFGIFAPAIQSGIVNSMDFPKKFFYCFAWGLRNLSSFGSNLQTSTFFWETLFSAATTIIGLLLFIYLIGNLQTYLQFTAKDSEKSRRKLKMKELDLDMWINSNGVPLDMRKESTYSTARTASAELERGGFHGELQLEWASTTPSSHAPISHKTAKTNSKAEAFALETRDMKKIAESSSSLRKLTLPSSTNVTKRRWGLLLSRSSRSRGGPRLKWWV